MKKWLFATMFLSMLTSCDNSDNNQTDECKDLRQECSEDKSHYFTCIDKKMIKIECGNGDTCRLVNNKAQCGSDTSSCANGTFRCSASGVRQVCTNGKFFDAPCTSGQVCVNGECKQNNAVIEECEDTFKDCDGKNRVVCRDKKKITLPCDEGTSCVKGDCVDNKLICDLGTLPYCVDNVRHTCDNGLLKKETCEFGCEHGICKNNSGSECVESCSGKDYSRCIDGKKITQSCEKWTGMKNSECKSFAPGVFGCEKPSTCKDIPEGGTCIDNNVVVCGNDGVEDTVGIISVDDSSLCAVDHNGAGIFEKCTDDQATCVSIENSPPNFVRTCFAVDAQKAKKIGKTGCASITEELSCSDTGELKKRSCPDTHDCVPSLGECAERCTEAELDKVKCSYIQGSSPKKDVNILRQCAKTAEGEYYYVVRSDARACVGKEKQVKCEKGTAKQTLCSGRNTEGQNAGKLIGGECTRNFQGLGIAVCDSETLIEECTDVYEKCEGDIVKKCVEYANGVKGRKEVNCATTPSMRTSCARVDNYTNCYFPCENEGELRCVDVGDSTQSIFRAERCDKSQDGSGKLVWNEYGVFCSEGIQYQCTADGKSIKKFNCAEKGGVCGEHQCEYPLCTSGKPASCSGNDGKYLRKCEIHDNIVVGETGYHCSALYGNTTYACFAVEDIGTCYEVCQDGTTSLGKCKDNKNVKRCRNKTVVEIACKPSETCREEKIGNVNIASCI